MAELRDIVFDELVEYSKETGKREFRLVELHDRILPVLETVFPENEIISSRLRRTLEELQDQGHIVLRRDGESGLKVDLQDSNSTDDIGSKPKSWYQEDESSYTNSPVGNSSSRIFGLDELTIEGEQGSKFTVSPENLIEQLRSQYPNSDVSKLARVLESEPKPSGVDQDEEGSSENTQSNHNTHTVDRNKYRTHTTIDVDSKVKGLIAVKIDSIDDSNQEGITEKLRGTDLEGGTFEIKIWKSHDIETDWEQGHWYAIQNVRSRIWATEQRNSVGMLISTVDMEIRDLGISPPETIVSGKNGGNSDQIQSESDAAITSNCPTVSELSRDSSDEEPRDDQTKVDTQNELTEHRQELLDEIERLSSELNRVPAAGDMKEHGEFSLNDYYSEFGKWKHAIEASRVDFRSDLIEDLKATADKLDKRPTTTEINNHGRYNYNHFTIFFENWEAAIEVAGVENPSKAELIDELQRLDQTHDRIPLSNLVQAEGKYAPVRYQEHFGSIDNALKEAGIHKAERLKDELERLSHVVEGELTTTKVNELGKYSSGTFSDVFGSWDSAKEAAEISPASSTRDQEILTRSDIPSDGRLSGRFPIQIVDIDDKSSRRIAIRCEVEDIYGQKLQLVIWATHDIKSNWRKGDWYVLDEARGKCWETDSGRTQHQLNSTGELEIQHIGPSMKKSWVPVDSEDTEETESDDEVAESESDDQKHGEQASDGKNTVSEEEELIDDLLDELGL